MSYRFSLHGAKLPRECELCGAEIPRRPSNPAEYWRVKGGPRNVSVPRIICCLCHALFGLPDDGWIEAADGRATITALVPQDNTI